MSTLPALKRNGKQMDRYEFIEKLRAALTGKATQSVINENVRYYEEYLDTEIRKGKSEAEVLESLGDPRLLAKTIIVAGKSGGRSAYSASDVDDVVDFSGNGNGERHKANINFNGRSYQVPGWALALVLVLAVVLVIAVVGFIFSFLLPIVLPLVLIIMAVQLIAILLGKK